MSDVIDPDGFRANVGIVLMQGAEVFLGRRTGGKGWQFPQGGLRRGEALEEALYRELHEEIGVRQSAVELVGRPIAGCATACRHVMSGAISTPCAPGRSSAGSCCACCTR